MCCPQDQCIPILRANQWPADVQDRRRHTARHRNSRLLRQVKGVRERRPGLPSAPWPTLRYLMPCFKRREREGRCQQHVEALMELGELHTQVCPLHSGLQIRLETVGTAFRRYFQQTGIHFGACLRLVTGQGLSRACIPEYPKEIEGIVERGSQFLDMRTEILKHFRRLLHGHRYLRINLYAAKLRDIGNSQTLHPSFQRLAIVHAIIWQGRPIAGIGPGDHVQHQRRICYSASHGAGMRQAAEWTHWPRGNPAKGGLQADTTAKARRYPDGTVTIGAYSEGGHPNDDSNGTSATRPSRGAALIPRIACDPGQRAVGHPLPAQFGGRGLAQQDDTASPKPFYSRCIIAPVLIWVNSKRTAQCRPAPCQEQILDRGGYTVQHAERLIVAPTLL